MNSPEVEGPDPCQDLLAFTQYHGNNHDDFQLMAEFHEQIGPNPVFMIPDKPAGIDHFDINSFAVCLLSKDVQDSANGFKAGRGSQTVIHFTCPGFRSYVFAYYFALCDIHARGYMRQFCMTFVSPDRDKLMHNFVHMKMKFDEVAAFLCHGNHKIFLKDVKQRLKNLRLTLAILEHSNAHDDEETDGGKLSRAASSSLTTVLMDVFERDPDSIRASIDEMEEIKSDLEKEMKDPKYAEVEHHMASSEYSTNRQRSWTAEESIKAAPRRRRSLSDSSTPDSSPYSSRHVLKYDSKRFERKLRSLSELTPQTYSIAYSKLEALHKEFSLSALQLMVKEAEAYLFWNTASVISIGNMPILSFASDTGEGDEEFRTPHGSPPPTCNKEADGPGFRLRTSSDGSLVIVSAQSSPLERRHGNMEIDGHAKEPLAPTSSDTHFSRQPPPEDHHVLASSQDDTQLSPAVGDVTQPPTVVDDVTQPPAAVDNVNQLSLSVDDVCELPLPTVNNGAKPSPPVDSVTQPSSSDDGIIDGHKEVGSSRQENASRSHAPPSSQDESELDGDQPSSDQPKMKVASTVTVQFESGINSLAIAMDILRGQSLKVAGAHGGRKQPRLVINEDDSSNSFSDSEFVTPAEDKTDFFLEPRMWRGLPESWQCYTEHIFNSTGQDKKRAGRNIFAFCRHHGAAKDILYALLRGRTLVILGKQKKQVQGFVQTLCLFVPGSGREHRVFRWLDGETEQDRGAGRMPRTAAAKLPASEESLLSMSHLQDYKLIGMNSAYSIPKHLQGLVSSWDIDTGKLQTPVYSGKLLYSIASRIKYEKSEEEFVARIHSVFVELTMKAFIYYQALMRDRLQKSKDMKTSRRVLGLLNSESDSDIVKYLSSIVISQQLVEAGLRSARPQVCVTFKPNKRIECKARQYQF